MSETRHVDLYRLEPLSAATARSFVKRLPLDDPLLVKPDLSPTQLAEGWATYFDVSEPHPIAECPHA